ncbi:hypothetical protein SeMB42_g07723 [Synchytrium endobioticum]|nr:hypothetical protein SeMB42_g07723 [Synchytrium endobioticum]
MSEDDPDKQAAADASAGLKSRALPKKVKEQLLNICAALGGVEDLVQEIENEDASISTTSARKYVVGDEALDCVRDLRKYLKFDHTSVERAISTQLGEWQILQDHLIPIFLSEDTDDKLRFAILELWVPMTWAIDPKTKNARLQLYILQDYKLAFLADDILQALRNELFKPLSVPFNERTSRENAKLRLILSLFRNLLGIKDVRASVSASHEEYFRAHLQEQLVLRMKEQAILETIVTFSASMEEKTFSEWNLLVLEIVYLLFKDRDPKELATGHERSDNVVLKDTMKEDQDRKRLVASISSRHSRFGGTLSIHLAPGKTHNVHSAPTALKSVDQALNVGKTNKSWNAGRKKAIIEKDIDTKSRVLDTQARSALAECAEQFLSEAFNVLMICVKKDFDAERTKVREDDHVRFLRVISFFLCYFSICQEKKPNKFDFDTVLGIVDVYGMKYVCKRLHLYRTEKKFTEVQITLDCLKDMLRVVDSMAGSSDEDYKQTSFQAQHKLFYEGANVQALALLCKDTTIQIPSYLEPLIETTHIYFKMLENFSKTRNNFIMRKAKRGGGSRHKEDKDTMNYYVDDTEIKMPTYAEKEVNMLEIERDFANEGVVLNYSAMLSHYQKCDERFLYYIAVMFHRIFVKLKSEAYFYKLSTLELFQRIMNDRATIQNTRGYREVYNFIKYAVSRLFKRLGENPLLYIQVFYPKFKKDSMRMILGELPETPPRPDPHAPLKFGDDEEIEVKQTIPYDQKLRVAVVALAEAGHKEFLNWFVKTWSSVCDARQDEEFDAEAARERGEDPPDIRDFELRGLEGQTPEIDNLLAKNNLVRMLFNLLGMTRLEVDEQVLWLIPKNLKMADFAVRRALLEEFLEDPTLPVKKSLAKLIVKKGEKKERKRKSRVAEIDSESPSTDHDSGDSDEGSGSQKNTKKKDKSRRDNDKRPKKRRKVNESDGEDDGPQRELSEKFILDSDDDEDYDEAFFRREADLRAKVTAKRKEEAEKLKADERRDLEQRVARLAERKRAIEARTKSFKDGDESTPATTQATTATAKSKIKAPRSATVKSGRNKPVISDDEARNSDSSSSSSSSDDEEDSDQLKSATEHSMSSFKQQGWWLDAD